MWRAAFCASWATCSWQLWCKPAGQKGYCTCMKVWRYYPNSFKSPFIAQCTRSTHLASIGSWSDFRADACFRFLDQMDSRLEMWELNSSGSPYLAISNTSASCMNYPDAWSRNGCIKSGANAAKLRTWNGQKRQWKSNEYAMEMTKQKPMKAENDGSRTALRKLTEKVHRKWLNKIQ